jgi:tetratricopeptide (TPR) repeat protein
MESRAPLERAATLLGRPLPTTRLRLAASLIGQVILQILHRLWPVRFIAHSQEVATSLELVLIYKQLAQLYFHNNEQALTIHALLRYLNLVETVGTSPELATAYVGACVSLALIPLPSLAESYAKRALAVGRQLNRPADLVWMFETIVLYRCGLGQWDSAQALGRDVIQLAEQVGDVQRREECLSLLALTHHFKGEFASSIQLWRTVFESSERRVNHRVQTWGLCGEVENGLPAGQLSTEQALNLMKQAQSLLSGKFDNADAIRVYGLLAQLYLWQGDPEAARHTAELGLRTIMQSQPTTFFSFSGYAGVAQVYLALWQTGSDHSSTDGEMPAKAARHACKALHKFARVFPFAQPRAWLYQGRYDWLAGKARKAHKAWQKSLTSARRLAMPYEAGLAHYEIGYHLATDNNPTRAEHLNRASEIFTQLEAACDLALVQEELKRGVAG